MANFDDNHFEDIFADEDSANDVSSNNTEGSEDIEVKPVKLSRGATAGIAIVAIIALFIFFCTLRSCTLEKKVKPNQNAEPSTQATQVVTEPNKNTPETESKNHQNSLVFEEPSSTPTESDTSSNLKLDSNAEDDDVDENPDKIEDGGLQEVVLPAFGEEISTKGIVVGKHTYNYEGSYVYGITISVLIGDDTQSVYYFCPKKTFDALSSTDTVSVSYQSDSGGNVSIISISK